MVTYVLSEELSLLATRAPVNQDRSTLVHSLVAATGLLEHNNMVVEEARPASFAQLTEFHSKEYIRALQQDDALTEENRAEFNLEYDCPVFPGLARMCSLLVGASLQAAESLRHGSRVAIAWDGGRHHAQKAAAAGYCYVNDVVISIFHLLESFRRVMYIDLDIHHGDGVQDAFYLTDKVLTVSMHKRAPGFYPGGGAMHDIGTGTGVGTDYVTRAFLAAFEQLAGGAFQCFRPTVAVIQCGADGLAGDPVGSSFCLTPKAIATCVSRAIGWGIPLLLLGGGGYDSPAVARCWTAATAAAAGLELPDDIPEHDYFMEYGPDFRLYSLPSPSLRADLNEPQEVADNCEWLLSQLQRAMAQSSGDS
eukprot:jgi/Tetstr1/434492/TSEL_023584.t1